MKNIVCLCLSIVLVFSILSSCSEQSEINNTHNASENTNNNIVPPMNHDFYFNSISELIDSFKNGFPKEDIDEIERQEMVNNRKGTFRNYVEEIKNNGLLYVPYYKGKEMQLSNRGDSFSILLLVNEGFDNRPVIWFYPREYNIVNSIRITYLDDRVSKNSSNRKFSEILREIAPPGFPNVDNYEQYKEIYTKIYDSELQLSDRTVKIIVKELVKDGWGQVAVAFIYDDIYVSLTVLPEYLTNGWFKDLSFEKVALKG